MNCVGHNGHTIERKPKEVPLIEKIRFYEESNFNILSVDSDSSDYGLYLILFTKTS